MNLKRFLILFSLFIFVNALTGCDRQPNIAILEFASPIVLKFRKHNLSPRDAAFLSRVSKTIASVAERHHYEETECDYAMGKDRYSPIAEPLGDYAMGKDRYSPVSCYKQKDQPKYVVYSHEMKNNNFIILISWFGNRPDSSVRQVQYELETGLQRLLGKPAKRYL